MSERDSFAEPESVARALERLREGVRQRQAALACLDELRGERPAVLAAVARDAALEEPSFRVEGVSGPRAFLERAAYVLFARRQHRSLLRQQSRFNRSAALALEDLHARQDLLARELRRASERVAALEACAGLAAAPDRAPDAAPAAQRGTGTS
jgi:hypothetical protein